MNRVTFTFKNGNKRMMHKLQADVLSKHGLGEYQTRDMADQPTIQKSADGLDEMDRAQLHALAKERGVAVHHLAGADRVRAALRGQ
jgi:hypothetical protein